MLDKNECDLRPLKNLAKREFPPNHPFRWLLEREADIVDKNTMIMMAYPL